jgi:hypothetical protein
MVLRRLPVVILAILSLAGAVFSGPAATEPATTEPAANKAVASKASKPSASMKAAPADSESRDEGEDAPKRIPDVTGKVFHEVLSIPYPNGAIYLSRGISGAFLGGKHHNLGDPQSLFQWQGEIGYFYTPWFSGGAGYKIIAGEPSNTEQKIVNRYFLLTRFHKAWNRVAIYAGPQLALDNLNVLSGAQTASDSVLRAPIKNTNAGLGLDLGLGWKFSRWVGFTMGSNVQYSLVGEEDSKNNNALNLHILPGFAVDILSFTETLRELVPAMYVTVEFQEGFLLFEKSGHRNDQAAIMGIGLAF